MYKKYYSYNDMPVPIKAEKPTAPERPAPVHEAVPETVVGHEVCEKDGKGGGFGRFLNNLQADDIILILVVFTLLMEDCEDKLLLAAIAFILFTS